MTMKSSIILALLCSMSLAATISGRCEQKCQEECIEVGKKYEGSSRSCLMVYGTGHKGLGWYIADSNGDNNLVTCSKSCEETCDILCTSTKTGNGQMEEEDRQYTNMAGSHYKDIADRRLLPIGSSRILGTPNFINVIEIVLWLILNFIIVEE